MTKSERSGYVFEKNSTGYYPSPIISAARAVNKNNNAAKNNFLAFSASRAESFFVFMVV